MQTQLQDIVQSTKNYTL